MPRMSTSGEKKFNSTNRIYGLLSAKVKTQIWKAKTWTMAFSVNRKAYGPTRHLKFINQTSVMILQLDVRFMSWYGTFLKHLLGLVSLFMEF